MTSTRFTYRWLERRCAARTMRYLVEPTLADVESECKEARLRGHQWVSRWHWMIGYLALLKALAVHAAAEANAPLTSLDRAVLRRACRLVAFTTASLVSVLMLIGLVTQPEPWDVTLLSMPSAVVRLLPIGIVFGVLAALSKSSVGLRLGRAVIVVGLLCSAASSAVQEWVIPPVQHILRTGTGGQQKSVAEMTFSELRARASELEREGNRAGYPLPLFLFRVHGRIASGLTPLALCAFALALASRTRAARRRPVWVTCAVLVGYFVATVAATIATAIRFPAGAWLPNALFVLLSLLLWLRVSPNHEARQTT